MHLGLTVRVKDRFFTILTLQGQLDLCLKLFRKKGYKPGFRRVHLLGPET